MNKQPTNKCSVCGKEYNYILSDGFCDGCRDCIKAQGLKLCDTIDQPKDEVKEDWVGDRAGSLWREIHQELLRGGVVFPNNFNGVGSAYGSLILIKQYLTQQKEAIETEKYNWGREVGIKECLEIIKGFESGKIVDLIEKIKSLIQ